MTDYRNYQPMRTSRRWVAGGLGLMVAFIVLAALGSWVIDRGFTERSRNVAPPIAIEGPSPEIHPVARLKHQEASDLERLHGYGWVDRDAGMAHIPIERAMALYLEQQEQQR